MTDHDPPPARDEPHANPDVWAPRLERVIDRQLELYRRLQEMGGRQGEFVRDGRTDELLALLGERQTIVDELTALNHELEPFTHRWAALEPTLPASHRDRLRARLDDLGGLIEAITARDDADRRALEARRDKVAQDITGVSRSKSAVNAYTRVGGASAPRYQDRQG